MDYSDFLKGKEKGFLSVGLDVDPSELNSMLFDFQRDIVRWALFKGRAAIFTGCGSGKTPMQLEWSRVVHERTRGNVLILAPLAVSRQTVREGRKFGIPVHSCRSQEDVKDGINITNYEMLSHFDPSSFVGIVLDESSILKSYTGSFRNMIIDSFHNTRYRLACTATPAPNDYMELGNHSEFLGVMSRTEMLSMYFVHDGGETSKWRLKGHARNVFWEWVCQWAVMITMPSDLGYDNGDFMLPELRIHEVIVNGKDIPSRGFPVVQDALDLMGRRRARRDSIVERVSMASELVNGSEDTWLVWCDLNQESSSLSKAIEGSVEVTGSDPNDHKERCVIDFSMGKVKCLVTKPSIAGFGMNWQNCHNVIYVGLSDSWEQFYQSVRRCWRFGQKEPVDVYVIISKQEKVVLENIKRKERDAESMLKGMVDGMKVVSKKELSRVTRRVSKYKEKKESGKGWTLYLGDSVEVMKILKSSSVGYSIFSPPFASLYTYSDSIRDMGNSKDEREFTEHFSFLVQELFRVMMDGRLVSIHCMNLPTSKERDGYIGLRDFRGTLIRMFEDVGFIFHSEVVIWKDPLIAAVRTKALGLLHKQLCKDSTMCRQGLPDYVVTMRKPGDNQERVAHPDGFTDFIGENPPRDGTFSHKVWQRYASPVWMDINPSNTLNKDLAREDKDEKHIAPLQLDVIERCLELWSTSGDLVLSPFAGIGSEGFCSVRKGRRFIGIELKESYFNLAVKYMRSAETSSSKELKGLF